jgi:hypothetical protein
MHAGDQDVDFLPGKVSMAAWMFAAERIRKKPLWLFSSPTNVCSMMGSLSTTNMFFIGCSLCRFYLSLAVLLDALFVVI